MKIDYGTSRPRRPPRRHQFLRSKQDVARDISKGSAAVVRASGRAVVGVARWASRPPIPPDELSQTIETLGLWFAIKKMVVVIVVGTIASFVMVFGLLFLLNLAL